MPEPPAVSPGDEVEFRKPHACGGSRWLILRTGADLRVKCLQCGRSVLIPRDQFNRAVKRVLNADERG
jgi:hypothetical protein